MAAISFPGAVQVGSYLVGQYDDVLQQQPDLLHRFLLRGQCHDRVDGDSLESASSILEIHTLVSSLNFTAIEIKTINSFDSWNGGVLLMVSGYVKIKDFNGRRKFVQNFFLAPEEKGFFVRCDILHFINDGMTYQLLSSTLQETSSMLD